MAGDVAREMSIRTDRGAIAVPERRARPAAQGSAPVRLVATSMSASAGRFGFRIWATQTLREFIIKGFILDDDRLKQGNTAFGKDYFEELLERIRASGAPTRRSPTSTRSPSTTMPTRRSPASSSRPYRTSCTGPSPGRRRRSSSTRRPTGCVPLYAVAGKQREHRGTDTAGGSARGSRHQQRCTGSPRGRGALTGDVPRAVAARPCGAAR
jgi:hypothetical protein